MARRTVANFDRIVTIQSPATTRSAYGGEVTTWTDVATVRAAVEWIRTKSDEAYNADMLVVTQQAVFTMRYRENFTEKCRLVFGNDIFDILNISEGENRRQYLRVVTEKRSSDNPA
jgi:SPP1 family predicted phage head-tail adaptor